MKKQINLKGRIINYKFRKNIRAKNLSLTIRQDAQIILTAPKYFPLFLIDIFLRKKADWIISKLNHCEIFKNNLLVCHSPNDYLKNKEKAIALVETKIKFFNYFYNFSIQSITIKNQRTRWGSCSENKNLNFNYKIIYLPENLVDYVIVHELCHLKEMNHSSAFWALVSLTIPDWKTRRQNLKNIFEK